MNVPLTEYHWKRLRDSLRQERVAAKERIQDPHNRQHDYWMGYAAALETVLNEQARIGNEKPPYIEDIETE